MVHRVLKTFESDSGKPVKFRKNFPECVHWCNEHVGGRSKTAKLEEFIANTEARWYVDWTDSSHDTVQFVFKDPGKAVLFKLTWGGA